MKISVIGCGNMGTNHARILRDLGVLDSIVEESEERKEILKSLGYGKFLRNSIDETESSGYVIATPSSLHFETLKSVLKRSNSVLLEKPALSSLEEYEEIIKNYNTENICVGHVERFNPTVEKMREIMPEISRMEFFRYSSFPKQIKDVGVWKDLGVHDVDLMVYFLGNPLSVVSHAVVKEGRDISFHASFNFDGGKSCTINSSWLSTVKRREIQTYTFAGEAKADLIQQKISFVNDHKRKTEPDNHFSPEVSQSKVVFEMARAEPLKKEIEHFLRVVEGKEKPLINLPHTMRVENILSKAYNSFQTKKEIEI